MKFARNADETRAVKTALANAGIPAKVTHGRGTACGWININLGPPASRNGSEPHPSGCGTQRTPEEEAYQAKALEIVREVTGRTGAYNGEIALRALEYI